MRRKTSINISEQSISTLGQTVSIQIIFTNYFSSSLFYY